MAKVCKRHADNPVMIYHQCVGCELEWFREELEQKQQEIEQLRQERDMYKSSSEVLYERLKKVAEQREKLVECLRFYERMARGREANDGGRRARTIFAEIGVTVE